MVEHRTVEVQTVEECTFLSGLQIPGISIQGNRQGGGTYEIILPVGRARQLIELLSREAGGKTAGRPKDI